MIANSPAGRNDTIAHATRQVVHSPEQYRIELPLAGPASRILAYAIDYVLIVLLEIALFTLLLLLVPVADEVSQLRNELAPLFEELEEGIKTGDVQVYENPLLLMMLGLFIIAQLVAEWTYFIFLEATTGGRSVGKAIVKLRVVSDGGHPLGFGQSVARNLLRAVDVLPSAYLVGLIAMVASDEGKRLGDLAAGTVVLRLDRPPPAPSIDSRPTPGGEVFRLDHEQVARIQDSEQRLARQTLRRLPDLDPKRAALVLEQASTVIARKIGHAPVPADRQQDFLRALIHAVENR